MSGSGNLPDVLPGHRWPPHSFPGFYRCPCGCDESVGCACKECFYKPLYERFRTPLGMVHRSPDCVERVEEMMATMAALENAALEELPL